MVGIPWVYPWGGCQNDGNPVRKYTTTDRYAGEGVKYFGSSALSVLSNSNDLARGIRKSATNDFCFQKAIMAS
jgi:hypothetical protein